MRATLVQCLGVAFTQKWLDALTRVETFRLKGAGKSTRRSMRATFSDEPLRSEDDLSVRYASLWLLCILERMPPGKCRASHNRLWLGHGRPTTRDARGNRSYWGLAGRVGRSPRECQRYLAIARSAGILDDWQPKGTDVPACLRGRRSGHAYAVYELQVDVPRELAELLAAHAGDPRTQPKARSLEIVEPVRQPASPQAQARARAMLAKVERPSTA